MTELKPLEEAAKKMVKYILQWVDGLPNSCYAEDATLFAAIC